MGGKIEDKELVCILSELLENAGDILAREPENSAILRVLTSRIGELTKSSTDKRLVGLSQFLEGYVDDIWGNMAIELTMNQVAEKIFRTLIQESGKKLIEISECLFEDKNLEFYETFSDLHISYQSKLDELTKMKDTITYSTGQMQHPDNVPVGKKGILEVLSEKEAVLKCEHTLTSGTQSDYFLNIDNILSDLESMDKISDAYAMEVEKIKGEIDKLAFIEKKAGPTGSIFLLYPIMVKTQVSSFIVDLKKEIPIGRIKGVAPEAGGSVAIISDTSTTGETLLKAANILREEGVKTPYAIVLFDREAKARERLREYDIELISILSLSDLERAGMIEISSKEILPKEKVIIPPAKWKIERYEKGVGEKTVEQMKELMIKL